MRNPERIPEVLSTIEALWKQWPDLRFWQFIEVLQGMVNVNSGRPQDSDLFYLEDDEFLRVMKEVKDVEG
jgi:uncharacterized protein YihD (DUF1040 family)